MGSGTLPVGAYVTLEHEFILIFRKNAKRKFATNADKAKRKESAFFWEERKNETRNIYAFSNLRILDCQWKPYPCSL